MLQHKVIKIQVVLIICVSISIMAMPFIPTSIKGEENLILLYIDAGVFWLAILANIIMIIWMNVKRQSDRRFRIIYRRDKKAKKIKWWKTNTLLPDIVSLIAIIFLVLLQTVLTQWNILFFIILGILIITLRLHWIFNGVNYTYLLYKEEKRNEVNN